jgi:predicted anti-sigma-YlaC factor YlaD
MWSLLKKDKDDCSRLRGALEVNPSAAALAPPLREHLAACEDCQRALDEQSASRELLRALPSRSLEPSPWFAPRVMAAIAARESELRRSLDTWAVLPRLAARLTWVSALALLVAGTWLYEVPRSAPQKSATDTSVESLFDSAPTQAPAPQDDLLRNMEAAE